MDRIDNRQAYVEIYAKVRSVAKQRMRSDDFSHDFTHVLRVRELALWLADETEEEDVVINRQVVELAALLHQARDWKHENKLDARGFLKSCECPDPMIE